MVSKEYVICIIETILLYFFVRKSLPYVIVDTMLCQLMNKEPGTIQTEQTFSESFSECLLFRVQVFRKSTIFQKKFHYRVQFFRKFSIQSTLFQKIFQAYRSTAFQKVFQTEYSFSESFPLQSTIFQIVFHIEYSFSECFPATIIMKFSKQITVFQKVFQTDHSFSESFPDREQFFRMFNI